MASTEKFAQTAAANAAELDALRTLLEKNLAATNAELASLDARLQALEQFSATAQQTIQKNAAPTAQNTQPAQSAPQNDRAQTTFYQKPLSPHDNYSSCIFVYDHVTDRIISRRKSHIVAGLLAIFLGCLGVHKFYLGYNSPGFILLGSSVVGGILTFSIATWIVFLVALTEGILYLTKSQDAFEYTYLRNRREWF